MMPTQFISKYKAPFLIAFPVLMGAILFSVIISINLAPTEPNNFEQLALGQETTPYFAKYNGEAIHCEDLSDSSDCIQGWEKRGKLPVVLWLGNSQLHSINQKREGDVTSTELLFLKVKESGLDLLTYSQPNANLQEHYLLFEYLQHRLPIRTLLMPVVFDDTRENGLRAGVASAMRDIEVAKELSKTDIGQALLSENQETGSDSDQTGLNDTPQKVVESALTDWLSLHWSLWEMRAGIRGNLYSMLYQYRNVIFNINAQAKRKKILGRYNKNKEALSAILQVCSKARINVILYIVPLRNDVEAPYVHSEYEEFKKDIASLANEYGAQFTDLEGLVPAVLWGKKGSTTANGDAELDFMHFQAGGHKLLAEAMYNLLKGNQFLDEKE